MATNISARSMESARQLAEQVRTTCVQTLIEAYEQAASDGLCAEGALEVALERVRILDLEKLIRANISSDGEEG